MSNDELIPNDDLIDLENAVPTLRDKIFTGIQCVYGPPGFLYIIYILAVMYSKKNARIFRTKYYFLVTVDLNTSIFVYLNTWTGNRMKNLPILVQALKQIELFSPGILTASRSLFNLFLPIQLSTSFVLTLYRLTTFPCIKANNNGKYSWMITAWQVSWLIISLAVFFIPLCLYGPSSHIFITDDKLVANNHPRTIHELVLISAKEAFIFSILYSGSWTRISIKLRGYFANIVVPASATNSYRRQNTIRRGAVIAFVNGFSCLVICAWSLASYFMESTSWFDSKLRLDILMFCSDFRTFATPICMAFDMNIRRDFEAKRKYLKNFFKKQTPPENPVVPNTVTLF